MLIWLICEETNYSIIDSLYRTVTLANPSLSLTTVLFLLNGLLFDKVDFIDFMKLLSVHNLLGGRLHMKTLSG